MRRLALLAVGGAVWLFLAAIPVFADGGPHVASINSGVGDGQFQYPNGIAVDGRGRVYVADSFNDRVQVWSY